MLYIKLRWLYNNGDQLVTHKKLVWWKNHTIWLTKYLNAGLKNRPIWIFAIILDFFAAKSVAANLFKNLFLSYSPVKIINDGEQFFLLFCKKKMVKKVCFSFLNKGKPSFYEIMKYMYFLLYLYVLPPFFPKRIMTYVFPSFFYFISFLNFKIFKKPLGDTIQGDY